MGVLGVTKVLRLSTRAKVLGALCGKALGTFKEAARRATCESDRVATLFSSAVCRNAATLDIMATFSLIRHKICATAEYMSGVEA